MTTISPVDALIIDADETILADVRPIVPDLHTLHALVGGYIEGVADTWGTWIAYCNEEGKLLGLPVNVRAGDVLCGPVVFLGPPDPAESGDSAAVPVHVTSLARTCGYLPAGVGEPS
ncbi:MAG: DUF3846 domain-containing protein [Nocardioidaceae bacterium]